MDTHHCGWTKNFLWLLHLDGSKRCTIARRLLEPRPATAIWSNHRQDSSLAFQGNHPLPTLGGQRPSCFTWWSGTFIRLGKVQPLIRMWGTHGKELDKRSKEQELPRVLWQLLHQLSAPGKPWKRWDLQMWYSQEEQKGVPTAVGVWVDVNKINLHTYGTQVMSTNTQPSATGSVLHRQRDGSRTSVPFPISYNSNMGGVDRGDQLRGCYNCHTKIRKFYKYIFNFLLDVSITNTFILWKNFGSATGMTLKEFCLQVTEQLIGDYCSCRRAGRGGGAIRPLPLMHFPLKVQDATGASKRGCCACYLQTRHKRTDSSWFCWEYNVWLCHSGVPETDCFFLWHKNRRQEE